ncbi:unnamed protein product, partial [Didymodactylos carnosus]
IIANANVHNWIDNSQRRSPTSTITSSKEETTYNEDNDEEEAAHFSPRSTPTTTFNVPRNRKLILSSSDFKQSLCELENRNHHKITVNDMPFQQQQQELVEVRDVTNPNLRSKFGF